jgi:hypothetical protein
MTKDQAIERAQHDAKRDRRKLAVLNLNRYSTIAFVVREYDADMAAHDYGLVAIIDENGAVLT